MQISSRQTDQNHSQRRKRSNTDDLVFIAGETNPLIFLNDFEKCNDVTTEKDKLYKLRNFVNDEDKSEFSTLFYKGDWDAARLTFLKKYSYIFTENKNNSLRFGFFEETSLRSFVNRKIISLSTYTTLTLNNQMEVILSELPNEIANLFILNLKMNSTKSEILEFCNSIQEFVDGLNAEAPASGSVTPTPQSEQQQCEVVQDMEIFNYESDVHSEVESSEGQSSGSACSRKRGKNKATRGRGRPKKISKRKEDSETSMDSSLSSASSASSLLQY